MTALVVAALRATSDTSQPVVPQASAGDPDAALFGARSNRLARPGPAQARVARAARAPRERVRTQPVQLARDPFRGLGAQEGTAVEPDSFSHGSTLVAAYQVGRFVDGGALAIGFSATRNAGQTWRSGLLPSLSRAAKPSGAAEFVADPSVAYDAKHRYWLIASLAALRSADTVVVSRSRNGVAWQTPITAVRSETLDKNWIACDNWLGSPHRGNCYLVFLIDNPLDAIVMRTSRDGGRTWSHNVVVARGTEANQTVNGAQPLVRPSGTVVVAYTALAGFATGGPHTIAVARSTDGGASFGAQEEVSSIVGQFFINGVRAPQFVSGDVDGGGTVYLTWHDCPDYECTGTDVVFSRSTNGTDWTEPQSLPAAPGRTSDDALLPALAVAPGTRGTKAKLAVAYYSLRCAWLEACSLDAFLNRSPDGGRSWRPPERINPKTMKLEWVADTNIGRMVGDYISTSFLGLRPVPVLALASAPAGGRFNQAIFASRLPPS